MSAVGRYVSAYSSGAGSYAATRRHIDIHGRENLDLVFTDVLGEDADNYRFLYESAAELGVPLTVLTEGRTIWEVFRDDKFLGNSRLANCSKFLKQRPFRAWLDEHCDPTNTTVIVGIDWSEVHRLPAMRKAYEPYGVSAPLTEPPWWDKHRILRDMRSRGLEPPRLYGFGMAHANCGGGCVRAGQGQFVHLLNVMPERFAEWEANEQKLRDQLGDVAILRDRTGGTSTPLTLRSLRERAEVGEQMDLFDIGGCGCFVDEVA